MDETSALSRLRGAGRKKITLPESGVEVEIRRVVPRELLGLNLLPVTAEEASAYEARRKSGGMTEQDRLREAEYAETILARGFYEPPLWAGPVRETPETHIHLSDLTNRDRDYALLEILRWSGMLREEIEPLRPFPGGAAGAEAGQAGEEISDFTKPLT